MEIQLVLKSHEQALVTKASQLVIFFAETLKRKTSQDWNLTVQPLPTQLKKYTLLRSPHVNKKSREQVQLKTCQVCIRLTKLKNPLAFLIILDGIKLLKLDGIQLKCSFKAHTSV
jgi:ribosomal protein S10